MFPIEFVVWECARFGLALDAQAQARMAAYADLLLEWNKRMNLTAITDAREVAEKHFLDSLYPLLYFRPEEGARVIDVGTGRAFPASYGKSRGRICG